MKDLRKFILIFIVAFIVLFTIEVVNAAFISSKDISYSNGKTNAITVGGALDELFVGLDINNNIGSTFINGTIADNIVNNQTVLNKNKDVLTTIDISDKFQISADSFQILEKQAIKLGNIVFIKLYVQTKEILEVGKSYTMSYSISGYSVFGGMATNHTAGSLDNNSFSVPSKIYVDSSRFYLSPVARNFASGYGAVIYGFLKLNS